MPFNIICVLQIDKHAQQTTLDSIILDSLLTNVINYGKPQSNADIEDMLLDGKIYFCPDFFLFL